MFVNTSIQKKLNPNPNGGGLVGGLGWSGVVGGAGWGGWVVCVWAVRVGGRRVGGKGWGPKPRKREGQGCGARKWREEKANSGNVGARRVRPRKVEGRRVGGPKFRAFFSSPDPLFVLPITEVFRGVAAVSARFHQYKCLHNTHVEFFEPPVTPRPPTKTKAAGVSDVQRAQMCVMHYAPYENRKVTTTCKRHRAEEQKISGE